MFEIFTLVNARRISSIVASHVVGACRFFPVSGHFLLESISGFFIFEDIFLKFKKKNPRRDLSTNFCAAVKSSPAARNRAVPPRAVFSFEMRFREDHFF